MNLSDVNSISEKSTNQVVNYIQSLHLEAVGGKLYNKKILALPQHAKKMNQYHDKKVFNFTSQPPSDAFRSNYRLQLSRPPKSCDVLYGNPYLIFDLSNSDGTNTVTTCMTSHFFQRLEIQMKGNVLKTIYPNEVYFNMLMNLRAEERDMIESLTNVTTSAISASGSRKMIMFIPLGEDYEINCQTLENNLDFVYYTNDSKASGTGVLVCNNLNLVWKHRALSGADNILYQSVFNSHAYLYKYLECVVLQSSMTLTAGTVSPFYLRSLAGERVAYMIISINQNDTNSNHGYTTYVSINSNISSDNLELLSPQNTKLLYSGFSTNSQLMQLDLLNDVQGIQLFNDNNLYVVKFCDSIETSNHGVENGYLHIPETNAEYRLNINPSSGFSSNTYSVRVHAYCHRNQYQCNGELITTK
jgi:hypothetical protein